MLRLVIDDYRTFAFQAEHARNVFDGYNLLVNNEWDEIWWDFDMGMTAGDTTLALARYIGHKPELVRGDPVMYIHTSNPVGAIRLEMALERWDTVRVRYSELKKLLDMEDEEEWE